MRRTLVLTATLVLAACSPAGAETARDFPRIQLSWDGGSGPARLAEGDRRRGIGYRHIGLEQAPAAIWFHYPEPRRVRFHMQGVAFPVRAWWIDPSGCVLDWTDMVPGTAGHRPPAPVGAVLEVPLRFRERYPLEPGDCIRTGPVSSGALDQSHDEEEEHRPQGGADQ